MRGKPEQNRQAQQAGEEIAHPLLHRPLSRRGLCRSAVLVAAAAPAAFAGAAGIDLDLTRDTDLLRGLMKMRGSLDDALVFGWLRAKRFAISEGRVVPLCGVVAATYNRFTRVSDALYSALTLEVTYYTDFNTGELLQTLQMPFSGERVDVPVHRFGPATGRFAVALDEKTDFTPTQNSNEGEFAPAGVVLMTKSIAPAEVSAGKLFLRHEEHGRVIPNTSKSGKPSLFYKESTLWSAPLADVLNAERMSVDAEVAYSSMTSWRPWMKMGDIPGHTSSNGYGGRVSTVRDLPPEWLQFTGQIYPEILADPAAVLDSMAG